MISTVFSRTAIGTVAAIALSGLSVPADAKDFIKAERPQQRGYSQAVITEGGKTVWLAGQTALQDDQVPADIAWLLFEPDRPAAGRLLLETALGARTGREPGNDGRVDAARGRHSAGPGPPRLSAQG